MTPPSTTHQVRFPTQTPEDLSQDQEWCEVTIGGETRKIRFHDYGRIYEIPGLYEHIFYEKLKCESPTVVSDLLLEAVTAAGQDPAEIPVLDLGAGNGIVGEALRDRGFKEIVGVDIIPEAGEAALRDRPDVYAEYHVCDMTDPPADVRAALEARKFKAMTSVAALGFGDIPPDVFTAAYDLVEDGGWIAFNIKQDFLGDDDDTGFEELIGGMLTGRGGIEKRGHRRYRHRLDVSGEPLYYEALVGIKCDAPS
jgi:trans-aconitate methyltransferase